MQPDHAGVISTRVRSLFRSGWTRLFLVLWIPWAAWLGWRMSTQEALRDSALKLHNSHFRLEQTFREQGRWADVEATRTAESKLVDPILESVDEMGDASFHFYFFGLAVPPLAAMAATWVARGFRRRSSTTIEPAE